MTERARRVLVVEDDPDIRDALCSCLREVGYDVHPAEHGKAALDLLERGLCPGAIVLDLVMPVMNGFEFLEAYRSRPEWSRLRVIVLSATVGHAHADLAGAFRVLRKPVSLEQLCRELEFALAAAHPSA